MNAAGWRLPQSAAATAVSQDATNELRWSHCGRLQQAWIVTERRGAAITPRKEWRDVPRQPLEETPPEPFIGAFGE